MGFTYAIMRLSNPSNREKGRDLNLLVNSGAIYSVVHEERLKELDIKPEGRQSFKMADGRIIEREFGIAIVEHEGKRAGTVVIFGEVDDTEVLGVHALEGLGLELDPVTKELRPMTPLLV